MVALENKLRTILTYFLILECAFQISGLTKLYPQIPKSFPHKSVTLELKFGFWKTGAPSLLWQNAIKYLRRNQSRTFSAARQPSPQETAWAILIKKRIPGWSGMTDSLRIPFGSVMPPDKVTILAGNQNGEDAFTYTDSTICFDMSRLIRLYGAASKPGNRNRIDRFFAHEFTHILHKAWRKEHSIILDSPLEKALWECLAEGLGNYRSLSFKWVSKNGELTKHSQLTLKRLQPIFVRRISALEKATDKEAESLMEGLSMGPFDQKWGALTVALWLAQEAKGSEYRLQKWVNAGPNGIIILAQKYLPIELKDKMPVLENTERTHHRSEE